MWCFLTDVKAAGGRRRARRGEREHVLDVAPRPFEHLETCETAGATARAAVPWQVRRAEEFIEAHWNQPITVEMLAEVAGTSERTLFHAFRASRGRSPMASVKQV